MELLTSITTLENCSKFPHAFMAVPISRVIFTYSTLREMCPYSELFWSAFSRNRTEYGEIFRISPYSARMRENTDQKTLNTVTFYAVKMLYISVYIVFGSVIFVVRAGRYFLCVFEFFLPSSLNSFDLSFNIINVKSLQT